MSSRFLALSLALSAAYASPVSRRDECSEQCALEYNSCRSDTSNLRSTCASNYSSCLGYNPFSAEGSLVTPTACSQAPAATSSVAETICVEQCSTEYDVCRSDTSNLRSTCASNFSSCLGYNPFNSEGSLVTPTACSQAPAATTTAAAGDCVQECNDQFDECRSDSSNLRSTCASEYSSCLGYVPFNSEGSLVTPTACSRSSTASASATAAPSDCVEECNNEYNECRSDSSNLRSTCASNYSSCLGYSPFNDEGSLVTPTACSTTPSATSTAAPTATSGPSECVQECNDEYDQCRSDSNNLRSTCASNYSSCLGYSPFNSEGTLVNPTECASDSSSDEDKWTVKELSRYCAEDGSGCDYNFGISIGDDITHCTVIRLDVPNALTESWAEQPCSGSDYVVSWGFSAQFSTPFAVLTIHNTDTDEIAYFGVNDPNGKEVTPRNPKGSGNFGDLGPSIVQAA